MIAKSSYLQPLVLAGLIVAAQPASAQQAQPGASEPAVDVLGHIRQLGNRAARDLVDDSAPPAPPAAVPPAATPDTPPPPPGQTVVETPAAPQPGPAAEAPTPTPPTPGGMTLSAADPEGIAERIRALGYRATISTDDAGDPKIDSAVDGSNYVLYFYGCQNGANCNALLFVVGFDLPNGVTLDVANRWNQENIIGSAYLDDEGDPFIQYFVTTTGDLSVPMFDDVVDWWAVTVRGFKEHIGL